MLGGESRELVELFNVAGDDDEAAAAAEVAPGCDGEAGDEGIISSWCSMGSVAAESAARFL